MESRHKCAKRATKRLTKGSNYLDLEHGDVQQSLEYAAWLTQEEVHMA